MLYLLLLIFSLSSFAAPSMESLKKMSDKEITSLLIKKHCKENTQQQTRAVKEEEMYLIYGCNEMRFTFKDHSLRVEKLHEHLFYLSVPKEVNALHQKIQNIYVQSKEYKRIKTRIDSDRAETLAKVAELLK